jgi:hypothetical protein
MFTAEGGKMKLAKMLFVLTAVMFLALTSGIFAAQRTVFGEMITNWG